jgi:O-antigen/teichoic acid export membrane protein
MGMTTAFFKTYYRVEDTNTKKSVISSALIFISATSFIFTIILVFLSPILSSFFFQTNEYSIYFIISLCTLFFDTCTIVPLSLFRAKDESKKYVIISVGKLVLGISLNILFVMVLQKGVLGILQAQLISTILFFLILVPKSIVSAGIKFSTKLLKEMLGFGLPLIFSQIGSYILILSDRYFLNFFSTSTELGLYSLGYKFGLIINALIAQPFQLAWLPFIFSIKEDANAKLIYSRILTYISAVTMFVVLALSLLTKPILVIMSTPPFYAASTVVPIISLSYAFYVFYLATATPFYLKNKTRLLAILVSLAAVLNLLLNYLLIPSYGMIGAGIATLISYIALFLATLIIGRKYYSIPYEYKRFFIIILITVVIFVANQYIDSPSLLITVIIKLASLVIFPILLFAFRFFRKDELQKIKDISSNTYRHVKSKTFRNDNKNNN